MSSFIYTPKGYVNLNNVQMAKFKDDGRFEIIVNDEIVDANHLGLSDTIVSLSQPQGDWLYVCHCGEEDGTTSITKEPIIAWGLNVLGDIKPITPSNLGEFHDSEYGMQKRGEAEVYSRGTVYKNEKAWSEAVLENEKRHRLAS